ncbi:MFS transporter [Pseudomonas sp. GD03842]|uniref:MFS transporter n=1 Tax=Pseudomonas sp. GD03842 TaxID=2975385 RepID=UPI00244B017D|nr:MFS transporter [Pseudomonas sp. GD03842]MDH0745656.1 MFS transporter [Pseudomonas sp. GD03842]
MLTEWLSHALSRRGIHYGWAMVAVTFLASLVSAAAVGAPGIFIVPMQMEFGWNTVDISSALSIRFILFGLTAPFAAALMGKYGPRNVTISAIIVIMTSLLLSLGMTQVWQLMALWGIGVGVGAGMTALVLGAVVSSRWFNHRRGLVVGVLTASNATGQLIFMPLLASVSDHYGWRWALVVLSTMLAVAAVAVLMIMRDRPSDLGLRPYGDTGTAPIAEPAHNGHSIFAATLTTLRDAAKTRVFWILFGTFFVCGASTSGLVQVHLIPLCGDFGISPLQASGLLAAMGFCDLIGTVLSGWLSDRFDNRYLLFWYYGLRGLSLIALPYSDFSLLGLSAFAVFYGLDWIATVPPTVRLAISRFGPERAGLVFGWVFAGHQIGAAFAAFAAGWSRENVSSYLPAFMAAGVLCLVASAVIMTVRREKTAPVLATP